MSYLRLSNHALLPQLEHCRDRGLIISLTQFGNIVPGAFTPVLAKHSKSFSLIDCMSVGVDRMQRNSEPMRKQVEAWQRSELTDVRAKVVIYEAFVEGKLEAPSIWRELSMICTFYVGQRFMWRPPRDAREDESITAEQRT